MPERPTAIARSLPAAAVLAVCCALPAGAAALVETSFGRTLVGQLITRRAGTLAPGTRVPARDVGKRVFLDARHGVALAGVGQAQYAVATVNGGATWRTSGPALHVAAAQAPLGVEEVGAASRSVYWAAGGGEVVDATPDGGRHWYRTLFAGGVIGVLPQGGRLVALIAPLGGSQAATWISTDRGRSWRYEPAP
jgi:hypothetical protein